MIIILILYFIRKEAAAIDTNLQFNCGNGETNRDTEMRKVLHLCGKVTGGHSINICEKTERIIIIIIITTIIRIIICVNCIVLLCNYDLQIPGGRSPWRINVLCDA